MIEYTDEQHDSLIRGHRKQLADAQATVEALQRERDALKLVNETHMKTVMKLSHIVEQNSAALDAEREKVRTLERVTQEDVDTIAGIRKQLTHLQALVRAKETAYEKILLSRERLEREVRGYSPVDNEGIPMVWEEPVGWVKRHHGRHNASDERRRR